jgi:hypothetical protein
MMLPVGSVLARDAVARQFDYPETETALPAAATTAPVGVRSRARLAGALHRAADAVAPAQYHPAH